MNHSSYFYNTNGTLEFSSTKKYTTYKYHIQAHSARLQSTRNDNGPFQN